MFGVDITQVMQHIWAKVSQSLRDQFGKHEKKAYSLEEVVFAETTIQRCKRTQSLGLDLLLVHSDRVIQLISILFNIFIVLAYSLRYFVRVDCYKTIFLAKYSTCAMGRCDFHP